MSEKYAVHICRTATCKAMKRTGTMVLLSSHRERMEQNLDVFDFTLSDGEMDAIRTLDEGKSLFFDHYDPATVEMLTNMGKTRIV